MSTTSRRLGRRDITVRCRGCGKHISTTEAFIGGRWRVEPKRCPGCDQLIVNQAGDVISIRVNRR
jgi:phage FluMu protein Com